MPDQKDYSQWTLEALSLEEKKFTKNRTLAVRIMVVLVVVVVFSILITEIELFYLFAPLLVIIEFYRASKKDKQNLEKIKAEIAHRNAM
jgi:hypothetical protein